MNYDAQFELGRLKERCGLHPDLQLLLTRAEARIVDLLTAFRAFRYYAPGQGGAASQEFLRVHFTDVPDAERQRVRRELEEYGGQDTEGMIWIGGAVVFSPTRQSLIRFHYSRLPVVVWFAFSPPSQCPAKFGQGCSVESLEVI